MGCVIGYGIRDSLVGRFVGPAKTRGELNRKLTCFVEKNREICTSGNGGKVTELVDSVITKFSVAIELQLKRGGRLDEFCSRFKSK